MRKNQASFALHRSGGVGFEQVEWFNGGLFDDDEALPLEKDDVAEVLAAARLDWAEIDPSIFGTLFERGLDPAKRSQLGAHYTDRDKINLIIEPVIVRPLMTEWETEKAAIQETLKRADTAKAPSTRTKGRKEAEREKMGLRPSRWCKLGDGHQHCASGRGQRGNGRFIISNHASHGLQRQVTVL